MINNCFNYVGSKDRIYEVITTNMDRSKKYLIDVFCGSGVIGVNEAPYYEKVILNDKCWQMAKTLKYFRDNDTEEILKEIDDMIQKFELSKDNKEGYNNLRDFYASDYSQEDNFNPVAFYCLLTHSFNYNIQINKSGGFSVPFGASKSFFNPKLREKFMAFQGMLNVDKDKISIKNLDFYDLIMKSKSFITDTIFYLDPPYLASDSSYGRIHYLGKWDAIKEKRLYESLDFIHENKGSFLLSNVLENNGNENTVLKEWSKKYNIVNVTSDFSNCNYQRKNNGKTVEVLVRNY